MKKRILSLLLALGLLLTPASALTVEQAKEILNTYYIDEIPEEVLAQPTIEEILDALGDPYTDYYNAEEYAAFLNALEDTQLVGIGIKSYYLESGVLLDQVAPDSPAAEAGLQAGDTIIAVNGNDTRGAGESEIDGWIRGKEGTSVRLTVLRDGETFQATLTRRPVVFPTVILEKIENEVAWISCSAFGSTTFQYFYDIITAHDDEVQGWVVDLRGNGGGDVMAAVFSAGCFAGLGQGVYLRDREGSYYSYLNDPTLIAGLGYYDGDLSAFSERGYLTMDPVYVLTDGGTASASELFCAAIRDSGAGLIIGERTFGKGVAQTLFSEEFSPAGMEHYFQDGDALKVTTERGYATMGGTYDKVGILPHFLVDADLADEVTALLAAPVTEDEDALILVDLSTVSQLVSGMVLPMSLLSDPANADAVTQLFSALPATASCRLRVDGVISEVTSAEAAEACGVAPAEDTFSDLQDCAFPEVIETLGSYGIIGGSGDGTFRPGDSMDRASLCALLVKALRYPVSENSVCFADVPGDAWYAPYVSTLYEMGLVRGYSDGLFHPDDPVTHEQFQAILGRVAQWLSMDYYEMARHDGIYGDLLPDPETLAERYPGYSSWARESAWLCDDIYGLAGMYWVEGTAPATRENVAVALYILFRMTGVLPV